MNYSCIEDRKNKYLSLNAPSKIALMDLDSISYFDSPAFAKHHRVYYGGLVLLRLLLMNQEKMLKR